ncbi:MAG: carbohydrate-binding module family 20 domain-containing protein, partial [Limisphaerales bacterium]
MKRQFIQLALSLCTALSAFAVPITFQLDLGPRINTGEFIPDPDEVVVRGSFNNWTGGVNLTPVSETSTLYTGTADVTGDTGSTVEFKFVQLRADTADAWETTPNRAFALPASATTLPVSYFNNVWEGAPIPVKFQVNMATQQAADAFDPANGDFVEVRGSFNAWSGGVTTLAPSAENPDVYEATAEIPDAPGSRGEYKFV